MYPLIKFLFRFDIIILVIDQGKSYKFFQLYTFAAVETLTCAQTRVKDVHSTDNSLLNSELSQSFEI